MLITECVCVCLCVTYMEKKTPSQLILVISAIVILFLFYTQLYMIAVVYCCCLVFRSYFPRPAALFDPSNFFFFSLFGRNNSISEQTNQMIISG